MKGKEFLGWLICAAVVAVIAWFGMFYFYGENVLLEQIQVKEITDADWVNGYATYGLLSCAVGMLCGLIWFMMGSGYDGSGSVTWKYYFLLALSAVGGFGVYLFFSGQYPAESDTGLSTVFFVITPLMVYYLSTLLASPADVKYVPPLAESVR